MIVDALRDIDEVTPAYEVSPVYVTIALATGACKRDRPAIVHEARRDIERGLQEAPVFDEYVEQYEW